MKEKENIGRHIKKVEWDMNKILVTGGAGFIGSYIVKKLTAMGHNVVIVDDLSSGSAENVEKGCKFYKADITDSCLLEIFEAEQPDYVLHEAAQSSVGKSIENPIFDANTNIIGTINVLECCRKTRVKKVIYASSAAVYGYPEYLGIDEKHRVKPVSFYGISKCVCEEYIRVYKELYGLCFTILRYANVYGGRQGSKGEGGVISIFIDCMLNGKSPVIYGSGEQTRDFIYVEDVAAANILALEKGDNEVFNIGTGVGISINDLFEHLNSIIGTSGCIYEKKREGEITYSYFNVEKSRSIMGWKAKHQLETGLNKTIDYYKNIQRQKTGIYKAEK